LIARLRWIHLLLVAVGVGATLAIAFAPSLSFGFRSPPLHAAIDTTGAVASFLAGYILYGRFRRSHLLSEFALFAGLSIFALANLATAIAPAAKNINAIVWTPLMARVIALATLAVAAVAPVREVRDAPRARRAVAAAIAAGAVFLLAVGLLSPHLATGIDPNLSPASSNHPRVIGSPALLSLQILALILAMLASAGFIRRAERTGDRLMAWLSIATTFSALSRLNYFLFPSIYSNYVFTGDFLRIGFYGSILAGALGEISAYQRAAAREERARVARDLHDSLAQDLAFISMEGRRLAAREPAAAPLAAAAEDALRTSRATLFELHGEDEALPAALARLAGSLAGRRGVRLQLDIDNRADAAPDARNGLLRITSEAISNAIRHGHASQVSVKLEERGGLRLSILDDGCGFDPAALPSNGAEDGGFGLAGMRERVASLGGALSIRSRPGGGTEIEVVLP
jgi:signal transduction histidine kinase